MTNRAHRTVVVTLVLTLACAAGALAAGPIKGRTYEGGAPSTGVDHEGHRQRMHTGGSISLRIARSGRSLTVRFSSSSPILYCITNQHLQVQSTKPASISGAGTFRANIAERFANSVAGEDARPLVIGSEERDRAITFRVFLPRLRCGAEVLSRL